MHMHQLLFCHELDQAKSVQVLSIDKYRQVGYSL